MPGSFFSRSPSLDPQFVQSVDRPRTVRFANDTLRSPAKRASTSNGYPVKSRPQTPRSYNNTQSQETDEGTDSDEDSLPEETPSRPNRRTSRTFAEQSPVSAEASPVRPKAVSVKGKEREIVREEQEEEPLDVDEVYDHNDTIVLEDVPEISFNTQVKNKERELHDARQAERRYQSEDNIDDDERQQDKLKIKALEEEVKRLQTEV